MYYFLSHLIFLTSLSLSPHQHHNSLHMVVEDVYVGMDWLHPDNPEVDGEAGNEHLRHELRILGGAVHIGEGIGTLACKRSREGERWHGRTVVVRIRRLFHSFGQV